jgi:hypothetical protein
MAMMHPVHVSILNVEFNSANHSMDLSFKVFTNDIDLAIGHNYNVALNFGKPNENPEAISYINKYFAEVFSISINNKDHPRLVFVKKEFNEDAVWLHFTIGLNDRVHEFVIKDVLLMDIFEDQTNLVILSINGKESGYRLNIKNRDATIKI